MNQTEKYKDYPYLIKGKVLSCIFNHEEKFNTLTEMYKTKTEHVCDFIDMKLKEETTEFQNALYRLITRGLLMKGDKKRIDLFTINGLRDRDNKLEMLSLAIDVIEEFIDCMIVHARLVECDVDNKYKHMLDHTDLMPNDFPIAFEDFILTTVEYISNHVTDIAQLDTDSDAKRYMYKIIFDNIKVCHHDYDLVLDVLIEYLTIFKLNKGSGIAQDVLLGLR